MSHDSLEKVGERKKIRKKVKYNKITGKKELSSSLHAAWQIEEHKSLQRKKHSWISRETDFTWLIYNHMPHLLLLKINESAYPLTAQGHW